MEINKYLYSKALSKALKVQFLTNREELFLYAGALYSAMMWGREIDEKNKAIQEMDKPIKQKEEESDRTTNLNSSSSHDYDANILFTF